MMILDTAMQSGMSAMSDYKQKNVSDGLRAALEAAPERIEDILRVAKGLRALTETSAGSNYIIALERKAHKSPH